MHKNFWKALDRLISDGQVVIDRPKGSPHPRFPDMIYPLDYGYLQGTKAGDGEGIDVWCGSGRQQDLVAVVLCIDSLKKDLEIKMVLGCNEEEKYTILNFFLNTHSMDVLILNREEAAS